jgi:hypothetical protein
MQEIWKSLKEIVEYGDYYEVSNMGNVRSVDRMVDNRKGVYLKKGSDLKQTPSSKGYLNVGLHFDGKIKRYRVHKLVAMVFIPNPEEKPFVNHIDGNKENNCVSNLEWCTHKENVQHSFETSLNPTKGEGNIHAKLTEHDVVEIRKLYKTGEYTHRQLAQMFNVNHSSIGTLLRGKSWKHVV